MANNENLIPMSERSQSEAREFGKKGGIASGEARRQKKAMREVLEVALEMPHVDMLSGERKTKAEAVVSSLIQKAIDGDTSAARLIIQSIYGLPTATVAVEAEIDPEVRAHVEAVLAGDYDG